MSLLERLHAILFPALLVIPALAGVAALVFLYAILTGGLDIQAVPAVVLAAATGGAISLYFLPGILCGQARDMRLYAIAIVFLYVAAGLNLLQYQGKLWFQALAFIGVLDFLAVVALFYDQREDLEDSAPYRSMLLCSVILAALFGLIGYELLADLTSGRPPISGRIALTGQGAAFMVCVAFICAFYGPRRPRLFWVLMGLALFYIWLAVPAIGLEAYLPHSDPSAAPPTTLMAERFHQHAWKWLLGLCVAALIFTIRLLILCLDKRREALRQE